MGQPWVLSLKPSLGTRSHITPDFRRMTPVMATTYSRVSGMCTHRGGWVEELTGASLAILLPREYVYMIHVGAGNSSSDPNCSSSQPHRLSGCIRW